MPNASDRHGQHLRMTIEAHCPRCDRSRTFGPGSPSTDGATETRTCQDCGAANDTPAYIHTPISESDFPL